MTTNRWPLVMLAGAVALVSCGGGDDARSVLSGDADEPAETAVTGTDPSATEPPATEPPATDPPSTDAPPATEPPSTEPPATEPPSTEPPPSAPPSLEGSAYCGASSQFYVEARALRSVDDGDDQAARLLFARMEASLAATLLNAPDEAAEATPRRMQAVFDVVLPAFDEVDYDIDAIDGLPNVAEVEENLQAFVDIVEELEVFLEQGCNVEPSSLDQQAIDLAAEVSSGPITTDPVQNDDDPIPPDVQSIIDDSGSITVDVPVSWTEVRGEPDGELRQLIAAPDVDAFFGGYSEPGVAILSGDAPAGNGAEAATGALDGFRGAAEGEGCSQNIAVPYDDGLYTGDEYLYSCPGTDSVLHLAAGTNPAGDVFWLLAVVTVDGDDGTWTLVTDSFFVD